MANYTKKYNFHNLKVGESVIDKGVTRSVDSKMYRAANAWGLQVERYFSGKRVGNDYQITRVK